MDGRPPQVLRVRHRELEPSRSALHCYIGHTADLRQRLADHNARKCPHTSKFVPWKIKLYVAFETLEQAQRFERYLKSGSGHVFAKRHFWIKEVNSNSSAGNSTKAQR